MATSDIRKAFLFMTSTSDIVDGDVDGGDDDGDDDRRPAATVNKNRVQFII
jgi:hypothetical protein